MWRVAIACLVALAGSGCAAVGFNQAQQCDDCVPKRMALTRGYPRKLDNLLTSRTAQQCARRDLKEMDCDDLGKDFRAGYVQAYCDLAMGRPACVPAVPPPKYWQAWYRSCAGRDAVEHWYAGYRNGLDNGVNGGVSHFNRIVPNLDGGCVSAAYVNPYATATPPSIVRPLNGQTITQSREEPPPDPLAADDLTPPPVSDNAEIDLASGPRESSVPAQDDAADAP